MTDSQDKPAKYSRRRHLFGLSSPPNKSTSHHQRAFLPAALEVLETPPSPTGRTVLWSLLLLVCIALLWACLGKIDIVVSASGRVVPTGNVKVIQAPETASVATIHVAEGAHVIAGERLISFDNTYANADKLRTAQKTAHYKLQAHWRRAIAQWLSLTGNAALKDELPPYAEASEAQFNLAAATYQRFRHEVTARLESLQRDLAATVAELESLRYEEKRAHSGLQILDERVEIYSALVDKQYGAKLQYLELLQQQSDLRSSIPMLHARQTQLQESAAATQARLQTAREEIRKNNLMELSQIEAELATLEQEARKSSLRQQMLNVTAPVSGTVQELSVHTKGAVVTAAQPLLKIVPDRAAVEVEALMQNRDIGFVYEGQRAQVKVEAFNFTKYGLLEAKVIDISDDAIQDENLGWAYKVRLALEADELTVEGKHVAISPGMTITAEIMTGRRRLIEFFLSPLLRYRQESLRQR